MSSWFVPIVVIAAIVTPWGLFRHYWVVLKMVITVFSTAILLIYMGTFREMAGVAADPVVELGLVRNPSPVVHAMMALLLLGSATVLGIYKPFGMTAYGRRAQSDPRQVVVSTVLQPARAMRSGTPRWKYLAGMIALSIALLFLLLHLTGTGFHR